MTAQRKKQLIDLEGRWIHRLITMLLGGLLFFAGKIYNRFDEIQLRSERHEERLKNAEDNIKTLNAAVFYNGVKQ